MESDIIRELGVDHEVLGRDVIGRVWVGKTENTRYILGIWRDGGLVVVQEWGFIPERVVFDFLGNSVLLFRSKSEGIILSLENQEIRE